MRICQGIGRTPLIRISDQIYAKLESVNPSGSIKDRMACYILNKAEELGDIKPGDTIIEATSGNTGIAFAMLAANRGYKMIVVMPCNMSDERKEMLRSFGAEIVEVGAGDFLGAVAKRDELLQKYHGFNPDQFSNPDNVECHEMRTGQEILQQVADLPGTPKISAFVAGVGTGGTLMGVRKALLKKFPEVKTVAVEPTEAAVMSGGTPGDHSIQGIGDGFIPDIAKMDLIDVIITVSSEEATTRTKRLMKELGAFVGISSGANVVAAEKYIATHDPDGLVITVLPDRAERYASMMKSCK